MSSAIWKYELEITDSQVITMPKGASVLTVQMQAERPVLWALVDRTQTFEDREFMTYGTGHPVPLIPGDYVGTYQTGPLVFHVFEA